MAGARAVAEYLLTQGAPLALPTATMLGQRAEVARQLADDPHRLQMAGAHGIPLLPHAAFSGDVALVADLFARGAPAGVALALGNATATGHLAVVQWLLLNARPDLTWRDWQGQTLVEIAAAPPKLGQGRKGRGGRGLKRAPWPTPRPGRGATRQGGAAKNRRPPGWTDASPKFDLGL